MGSYNAGVSWYARRLPTPGETIIADSFQEGPGGKGSNQVIAAARFGAPTQFLACIGADRYGADALALYRRFRISTRLIKRVKGAHTGMGGILVDRQGRNLIAVAPGANLRLSRADIAAAAPVFKRSLLVGFQLENDHDTVFYGLRQARACGAQTFLDPAPAAPLPRALYPFIDIIKPNEHEAARLTGLPVTDAAGAEQAGRWFVRRGVRIAIITLGAAGAVRVVGNAVRRFPAPRVKAIDTTGAGDIFSGALLAALARGRALDDAIVFAIAASALSTTRPGVVESIPSPVEVSRLCRKHPA